MDPDVVNSFIARVHRLDAISTAGIGGEDVSALLLDAFASMDGMDAAHERLPDELVALTERVVGYLQSLDWPAPRVIQATGPGPHSLNL